MQLELPIGIIIIVVLWVYDLYREVKVGPFQIHSWSSIKGRLHINANIGVSLIGEKQCQSPNGVVCQRHI